MDVDKSSEEILCSKLINTYNTTILDEMDLDMQEALRKQAKAKAKECAGKERTVLKELIERHYNPVLQSKRQKLLPHYIGGPFNLTCHWSETYQKLIYIFGERHSYKTDCKNFFKKFYKNDEEEEEEEETGRMLIEKFLQELIDISDCFLDLFLEFEGYEGYEYTKNLSTLKDSNYRLVKIATTFSSCINATERDREEKCSRSRIHYFDVRSIDGYDKKKPDPVSLFISEYINIISQYRHIQDIEVSEAHAFADELITMTKNYPQIMTGFLLKINDKDYFQFWNGMLSKNHYTNKEFEHLGDNHNIGETIKQFIKTEMELELKKGVKNEVKNGVYQCTPCCELINKIAKLIMDNIESTDRTKSEKDRDTLKDIDLIQNFESLIHLVVTSANASVIDAYLLARIFKKFNLNSEKRRSTDEPDEARNIIIYAGNGHSEKYRKFLIQIGFELLANIGEENLGEEDLEEEDLEEEDLGDGKKPNNCINMRSKDKEKSKYTKKWTMQPLFSQWPPKKDPNLDVSVKEDKKSWGCNVMFRPTKLYIKPEKSSPNKRTTPDTPDNSKKPRQVKKYTTKRVNTP